jgi:hypothetical protein
MHCLPTLCISGAPQEAVLQTTLCADGLRQVRSRDRPRWVNTGNAPGVFGARDIERSEGALAGPQVAVEPGLVASRDRPRRVDAAGPGRHGARRIERGERALAGPQEAVLHGACVLEGSRDRPLRVDGGGVGVCGAQGIELGEGGVAGPQEAVTCGIVTRLSRDHPRRVNSQGDGASGGCGAWGIERGEGALAGPQEAVLHEACVKVVSRDRPFRVDSVALGECGARGIERYEGAVAGAQEAVTRDGVTVKSRNHPLGVDVCGEGACGEGVGTCGARAIKLGDGAVAGPQEAVKRGVCVSVDSCDRSPRVDGGGSGARAETGEACGARDIKRDEGSGLGRSVRARGYLLSVQLQLKALLTPNNLLKNG